MQVSPTVRVIALRAFAIALGLNLGLSGCNSRPTKKQSSAAASATKKNTQKPHFVRYQHGAKGVEPFIQEHVERGETEGLTVLVYVGAPWCEPCQHFHKALERGELDQLLAGTRLLEFDQDVDGSALQEAGYNHKLIPVIAVPETSGRSSGRMIEGSIKGARAVEDNLVPRLKALLEPRRL